MTLRRAAPLFTSWPVLVASVALACSGTLPDQDGDEAGDSGVELEVWEAREGTVSIVGASLSVPVSNQSWSGYRDGSDEFVRCTHDPDSLASDRPVLSIEAGLGLRGTPQLSLSVYDVFLREPFQSSLSPSVDDSEFSAADLHVSLSPELEDGAYVYGLGTDDNVAPPTVSSCELTVSRFSDDQLVGKLTCKDLLPLEGSPDVPITNAPYPTAEVSITFDCPLMVLGDGQPGSDDDDGASTGGASGTGGSDGGGTGGSIQEPSCQGSATPCLLLSTASCSTSLGCSLEGDCGGFATSCYSLFNSYSCYSQDGCNWYNDDCSGSAWSCSLENSQYTCDSQQGCSWEESCEGVASTCSSFSSQFSCDAQPGCYWL